MVISSDIIIKEATVRIFAASRTNPDTDQLDRLSESDCKLSALYAQSTMRAKINIKIKGLIFGAIEPISGLKGPFRQFCEKFLGPVALEDCICLSLHFVYRRILSDWREFSMLPS